MEHLYTLSVPGRAGLLQLYTLRMQNGNPGQAPVAPFPSAAVSQYPPGAVPAHAILQVRENKRQLNSPEETNDPQWKRVRFEGVGAQASGGTATQFLAGGGVHVWGAAAASNVPNSSAASQRPAAEASPEDFPVVEALVRREGTDKFKRVQVDGQLNAVERADTVLVRLHPWTDRHLYTRLKVLRRHQLLNVMQLLQGMLCCVVNVVCSPIQGLC